MYSYYTSYYSDANEAAKYNCSSSLYINDLPGLRPIVCLSNTVKLKPYGDMYKIVE